MQGSSSSSSSSSFSYKWTYDVFLSFRGKDTRRGFTGFLYDALCEKGIRTFLDDKELRRGEEITPGLVKAIEESKIAIVVFSENYASSTFCLNELVQIIDCIKEKGRLVLPVFYKVDPCIVRHQTGSYGEALAKYEGVPYHEPEKVQKWRSALCKAANLSGFHYKDYGLECEYEFVKKIRKEVSTKINRTPLYITDHPVGLESRVQEVNSLLEVGSDHGVNMVGIYGMGGIGKSTIARAVYNLIADGFESMCFLSNVREKSIKKGLEQLQETLLFELIGENNIKFADVNRGISILKSRLNQKKVLLVLDDIDELKQLQALAGGVDWFGFGSKIIVATRDKHLLNVHGIERAYHVKEFNQREAFELFNWKAFKKSKVDPDFQAFSERAVLCGHGVPLALEVIGSNLCGKRIDEWISALKKYEENSEELIEEVLKVSYNSLKQDEKEIFLDIACFFNGEPLQYVKNILLRSRGFSPEYAIGVLIAKCLIKTTKYFELDRKVEMHHLIQDMGQKIVKQESPLEPGGRSRLWNDEEIIHVLEENTGTDKIQFMVLNKTRHEVQYSGNEFKKMTNLKVLIVDDVNFSQGPRYLPNSLRVLHWKGYPSSSLPSEFHRGKLAILDLDNSFFTWDKPLKKFEQLEVINFRSCEFLKQVSDLSGVPNLTKLYIDFCKNLIRIHDSIGFHDKLKVISAESCVNLRIFPHFIKSKSLEVLNLKYCSSLRYFPEILENMKYLSYINLGKTAIEELPCSIHNATGLSYLDLLFCKGLKKVPTCILKLPKLETLCVGKKRFQFNKERGEQDQVRSTEISISLRWCNFLDGFLPTFLGCLSNVRFLELGDSNLTLLPESIQVCQFLSYLNLDNCKQLREIRGIPPNIKVLSAINCTSLTPSALNLLVDQNIHSSQHTDFILPGTRIPKWFDHYGKGESLSFWFRNKFPDIALFVVGGPNKMFSKIMFECNISVNGNVLDYWFQSYPILEMKHTFLYDLRCQLHLDEQGMVYPEDEWNHAEISYIFKTYEVGRREKPLVQQTGIYIFDRARNQRDILFTNPNPKQSKRPHKWKYQLLGLKSCMLPQN